MLEAGTDMKNFTDFTIHGFSCHKLYHGCKDKNVSDKITLNISSMIYGMDKDHAKVFLKALHYNSFF